MTERWSHAEGDLVDVDDMDVGVEVCEECCEEILTDAAQFDDGDPFCAECWDECFGEA